MLLAWRCYEMSLGHTDTADAGVRMRRIVTGAGFGANSENAPRRVRTCIPTNLGTSSERYTQRAKATSIIARFALPSVAVLNLPFKNANLAVP